MKEIEQDKQMEKCPCSWIERMLPCPQPSTDWVQPLSKLQWLFFHRNRKNIPIIGMEPQKTLNSQSNSVKAQTGRSTFPDLKLYLSYCHQGSMVLTKKTDTWPMERNWGPSNKAWIHTQLTFETESRILKGKRIVSSIDSVRKTE